MGENGQILEAVGPSGPSKLPQTERIVCQCACIMAAGLCSRRKYPYSPHGGSLEILMVVGWGGGGG